VGDERPSWQVSNDKKQAERWFLTERRLYRKGMAKNTFLAAIQTEL